MLNPGSKKNYLRLTPAAILAIGVFFCLTSAAAGIPPARPIDHPQQPYTVTSERQVPLRADGIFRLVNSHGDITVTGTTGRMIRIRAVSPGILTRRSCDR